MKRLLLASLLALQFGAAHAEARVCATNAEPRTVVYPWMTIERWRSMHAEQLAVAEKGNVDLMFIGDSITEGWPAAQWNASFGKYRPANFGIGGDHTGNLLWRLQDPRLARLKPKAIVLLIGVNNLGLCGETPDQIFTGIKAVVAALRAQFPAARILLNAVLPTGQAPDSERRQQVLALNRQVATLGDGAHVLYRDYGARLVQPDGSIAPDIMPDFLHLSEQGYRLWADAMLPDIKKLME
jgi:lysophospholipase L1-like esterase